MSLRLSITRARLGATGGRAVRGAGLVVVVVLLTGLPLAFTGPSAIDALGTDPSSRTLTDRRGEALRVLPLPGGGRARWVSLAAVAPVVIDATLAGEDHRFFEHPGVDVRALVRAAHSWLRRGHVVSGGSTLAMQLARTLAPHPHGLLGKLREMVQALRLTQALGQTGVLEQYLNRVYYGQGAWGIEAASWSTFGKPAAALGAGEASLLAVLPRAPRRYDLQTAPGRAAALARRSEVLALLQGRGQLAPEARRQLEAEPLAFVTSPPPCRAPHFVDHVLAALPSPTAAGGVLATTLDLGLQGRIERAVAARREETGARGELGVVVLDPASGAVRAMVGSADYLEGAGGQVNITTAARHPGSTLKPFLYALAIERGASPASLAHDDLASLRDYHPRRQVRERGTVRFREALAGSFNLAAIDVLQGVGVAPLLERLRQAGLGPLPGTAAGYGLDLAAAYGAFVTGGIVHAARVRAAEPVVATRLFAADVSWLVMDMLADPQARRSAFGADLPFDLPFAVAAKTGTSSGFADTLAVAATREAVVAVWAGAFDGSGTRGRLAMWSAAPLARAALRAVADLRGAPLTLPAAPAGVVSRDVCALTGLLPGADCPHKREHFSAAAARGLGTCPGHAVSALEPSR